MTAHRRRLLQTRRCLDENQLQISNWNSSSVAACGPKRGTHLVWAIIKTNKIPNVMPMTSVWTSGEVWKCGISEVSFFQTGKIPSNVSWCFFNLPKFRKNFLVFTHPSWGRHSKLGPSIDNLAIVSLLLAWPPLDWRSLCYQTSDSLNLLCLEKLKV